MEAVASGGVGMMAFPVRSGTEEPRYPHFHKGEYQKGNCMLDQWPTLVDKIAQGIITKHVTVRYPYDKTLLDQQTSIAEQSMIRLVGVFSRWFCLVVRAYSQGSTFISGRGFP